MYHWHGLIKNFKALKLFGNFSESRALNQNKNGFPPWVAISWCTFVDVPSLTAFILPLKHSLQELCIALILKISIVAIGMPHSYLNFPTELQSTLFPKPGGHLPGLFSCSYLSRHICVILTPENLSTGCVFHSSSALICLVPSLLSAVHYSVPSVPCLKTCSWLLCLYEQVMFLGNISHREFDIFSFTTLLYHLNFYYTFNIFFWNSVSLWCLSWSLICGQKWLMSSWWY